MMKIIYYALVAILVGCFLGMFVTAWINTDKALDNREEWEAVYVLEQS